MKKINQGGNSERCNSSEGRETNDIHQFVRYFEDVDSVVANNDRLQNYLTAQRSLTRRLNDNGSECSQEALCNIYEENKKVCRYCRKGNHNENECPLFMNAVEQQGNILRTCNALSTDQSKKLAHFPQYVGSTDRQQLELNQKAQKDYDSKYCIFCEDYGHVLNTCKVIEQDSRKQSEGTWFNVEARKSKRSKNNTASSTEKVQKVSEIHDSEGDCIKGKQVKHILKLCHYCKEYGHVEDVCPLVQKALRGQKGKHSTIFPKVHKRDYIPSATPEVENIRKPRICNFCGNSAHDHKEEDCIEQNQYKHFNKKREDYLKQHGSLKDVCSSLNRHEKQLQNPRKSKTECSFCGDFDHSESECEEKLQYEYISKYCHYCQEYGHFQESCPFYKQAAKDLTKPRSSNASPKSLKRVPFESNVTSLTEDLTDLKICQICEEFGHNESDCFVKQQFDFYSKYCKHCKENGHYENDCILKNQTQFKNEKSDSNRTRLNNFSKKGPELKTGTEYTSICSDHCVCEDCHSIYHHEKNNNKSEKCTPKNTRKSTFKESFEEIADKLRFCTLCGSKGLINSCILKEIAAAK